MENNRGKGRGTGENVPRVFFSKRRGQERTRREGVSGLVEGREDYVTCRVAPHRRNDEGR
jgi:hypothetical protein